MAQTDAEKDQAAAAKQLQDLQEKIAAAEDRAAQAEAKVTDLEAEASKVVASAGAPLPPGRGTVTIDHTGKAQE